MSRLDEIKSKLLDPAVAASDLETVQKASSAWQAAAEAEKLEAEAMNLEEEREKVKTETQNIGALARGERQRFWIGVLVPLITGLGVIATLSVQIYQVNQNTKLQREASEATQWRNALQSLRLPTGLASRPGTTLVKSFLSSPSYQAQARGVILSLLLSLADVDEFEDFFRGIMDTTDWDNYQDVTRLSRRLAERYAELTNPGEGNKPPRTNIPPEVLQAALNREISIVGNALAQFLREHPDRPGNVRLDLGGANFSWQDLSNANLRGAILTDAVIAHSTVKGSDLRDVSEAGESLWTGTAWWRANKISPQLVEYLISKHSFDPKAPYYKDSSTMSEYCSAVASLGGKDPACQ